MTEQEQIIQNFKSKCETIVKQHISQKPGSADFESTPQQEIVELAEDILNMHSNMPNINAEQLKEDLDNVIKHQLYK